MIKRSGTLALIFAVFFSGCASHAAVKKPAASRFSEESEIGGKINEQILASFYPYTDPKVVQYVNKIGNELASCAERRDLKYRFTILYNDKIYAASAPGGYIYVTTSMLAFLQNEAELAAVLAHEIGELQHKNPRLSESRKVLEAVTRTGQVVGPAFGGIGVLAALGLTAVQAMADSTKLSPHQRLIQADGRALNYMVKAGYDPQGMLDILDKLLKARQRMTPFLYDYDQSRPVTEERMAALRQNFSKLQLLNKTFTVNYKSYQEITRGIREIYEP